jgi:hypothetical protein
LGESETIGQGFEQVIRHVSWGRVAGHRISIGIWTVELYFELIWLGKVSGRGAPRALCLEMFGDYSIFANSIVPESDSDDKPLLKYGNIERELNKMKYANQENSEFSLKSGSAYLFRHSMAIRACRAAF